MRIIKVTLFLFISIFFSIISVFSYSHSHFILDNGLELFFIPDKTNPICNFKFSVKTGTSNQTENNSGFYELYTRLFWTLNESFNTQNDAFNYYKSYGAFEIDQGCLTDESYYRFSFPSSSIKQILQTFSIHLKNPVLSEKNLSVEFNKLKKEAQEANESASGFINTAIAKAIYGKNFTHHNPLDYSGILKCKNTAACRAIISEIKNSKYVPNNSALFISGPFNENEILTLTEKYFSDWYSAPSSVVKKDAVQESKKYVLVSSDFSKEISQCVIHYPIKNITENTLNDSLLAASILENDAFSFKQKIISDNKTGIYETDYINVSSSENGNYPALIIQALCKITSDSPASQTEQIVSILKDTDEPEEYVFNYAYEHFYNNRKSQNANSKEYINYISNKWIFPFFSDNISSDLLLKSFYSDEPFIFILVHPDIYKKHKTSFSKALYKKITDSEIKTSNVFYTDKMTDEKPEETESFNILQELKNSITKTNLSNNIPVSISNNPDSSTVVINLETDYGEIEFKNREKGMASLITSAFAHNILNQIHQTQTLSLIAQTKISYRTYLTKSLITIECLCEDLYECINCISNALIYSDITHAQADELINQIKYQWRLDNNDQDFQLNMIALKTLYSGTVLEEYFSLYNDILPDLNFNKLRASYAMLLNSEKLKFSFTGNILDNEKLISEMEQNFGMLKTIETENTIFPKAEFSNITLKKKLQRIFTTDIPADKAPKRPLHLIPTTEFFDNAHIYFSSPLTKNNNSIIFKSLVYYITSKISIAGFESKAIFPKENMDWAGISFEKVKSINEIKKIYSETVSNLSESMNETTLLQIKQICISSHFNQLQNNSGINENNIQELEQLENATLSDYVFCVNEFFKDQILLYVFSSDTPQKAKKK